MLGVGSKGIISSTDFLGVGDSDPYHGRHFEDFETYTFFKGFTILFSNGWVE